MVMSVSSIFTRLRLYTDLCLVLATLGIVLTVVNTELHSHCSLSAREKDFIGRCGLRSSLFAWNSCDDGGAGQFKVGCNIRNMPLIRACPPAKRGPQMCTRLSLPLSRALISFEDSSPSLSLSFSSLAFCLCSIVTSSIAHIFLPAALYGTLFLFSSPVQAPRTASWAEPCALVGPAFASQSAHSSSEQQQQRQHVPSLFSLSLPFFFFFSFSPLFSLLLSPLL